MFVSLFSFLSPHLCSEGYLRISSQTSAKHHCTNGHLEAPNKLQFARKRQLFNCYHLPSKEKNAAPTIFKILVTIFGQVLVLICVENGFFAHNIACINLCKCHLSTKLNTPIRQSSLDLRTCRYCKQNYDNYLQHTIEWL